jgi:hypothetical protein
MAADGHLVALPDELRALIYFSNPMAAFGQKQTIGSEVFRPNAASCDRLIVIIIGRVQDNDGLSQAI